jgi:uncharacterized membrane protein
VTSERVIERQGTAGWALSILVTAIGLLDSLYLTWIKLADATSSCTGIGDCEAVNTSRYSELGGIPIALLGAGAYFVIAVLLFLERRFPEQSPNFRLGVFGLTLTGSLYSLYLTYLEIAVIHAICPFCLLSAISMFVLLITSIIRLKTDFSLD